MNDQTNRPGYELAALGELMLLTPDKLPPALAEELTVLQDMLEIAVAAEREEDTPVPPAYGKTASPTAVAESAKDDTPLTLRQDIARTYPTSIAALSQRKKDVYITVPRVVPEVQARVVQEVQSRVVKEGGSDA